MRIASDVESGKACSVNQLAGELESCVRQSAEAGQPLHEVEQTIHETVLRMGHEAMKLFLQLQPDGDLGPTVSNAIITRMEMTVLTAPTSLMPRILMYVKQTMIDALKRYSSMGVRSMTLATYDPASTT